MTFEEVLTSKKKNLKQVKCLNKNIFKKVWLIQITNIIL